MRLMSPKAPGEVPVAVSVDIDRCVHCGVCTGVCPSGALSMDVRSWHLVFSRGRCDGCGRCLETCPVGAIGDGRPTR